VEQLMSFIYSLQDVKISLERINEIHQSENEESRDNLMPKSGMRILYEMCKRHFGEKMTIGRDQCFELFRANGLATRRKTAPRTTNSNHNYYIYPDLLNTSPKLVAKRFGQLVVADITYVATDQG